jgi:hypothetical protein
MPLDITHLVTFLVGALSGAAGQYLGAKYTDRRRKKEAEKALTGLLKKMRELMPELIAEMSQDIRLEGYESVREFVLLPSERTLFNGGEKKRFVYFEAAIDNLIGKVQILEHEGLVIDVSPGNAPIYRMTEEFVELLKKAKT